MKRAALLLLICAAWMAPGLALARRPTLVELFTAQGCSSCAKADALGGKIADRAGVIVLTWPVDYWDYLGWKDTFAQPEFTERQRAYDDRFGLRDVYTPQVVVDGAAQTSGNKPEQVESLMHDARRVRGDPPQMQALPNGRIAVGSGPPPRGGADVWLIRYDPRAQDVEVKEGDNRGKTVSQRNVVRQLVRLGRWTGRPVVLRLPPPGEENLTMLIVVQGAHGGRIIGMLKRETPTA
jgi:hypothetical protein